MTTIARTRPALKDHVCPGIRVFHVTRHRVYRILDLHDEDRTAVMRSPDGVRFTIPYGDLVREYRLVQPFAEVPR